MPTQKRKPTICYITGDWSWGTEPLQPNGCAWYRCKLPMDELGKRGWITGMGFPGFSKEKGFGLIVQEGQVIHGWDIVVMKLLMQREVLEGMDYAESLGQKVVVDVDDWYEGLPESNRAFKVTDSKNNPDNNREIYAEIIRRAFAITVSTPFLYDYYSSKRKNVYLVRNGIDISIPGRWTNVPRNSAKHRMAIGWVGATDWRSHDLEQIAPWLSNYMGKNKLHFHHSGHNQSSPNACDLLQISKKHFRSCGLAPILSYPQLFRHFDIGIVPLNDIPFNHAKSFIKGLEYAAAGIPFVSSYSPEYQYLADCGIGKVAKSDSEWQEHLDALLDPRIRAYEKEKNKEVLSSFSMQVRGLDWDMAFRSILEQTW
jgi:hypothetical protein